MNDVYKEIGSILKDSGYEGDMSYATESVTDKMLYISIYCPAILLYSKVESIKKILHSYEVTISSNPNIECIIIKLVK